MRCPAPAVLSTGLVLLLLVALQVVSRAQSAEEEFVLRLEVEEAGAFNVSALIDLETNAVKLPVRALLQAFSVKVSPDTLPQELSGFYLQEDNPYRLSFPEKSLFVFDTLFRLEASALTMHSDGSCYLGLEYWGRAFRLPTTFDLQALTATMKPEVELPIIRNARLAEKRNRAGGGKKTEGSPPDTVFSRHRHWLRGGSADYQANWRGNGNGAGFWQARVDAGIELLGGSTTISLQHASEQDFRWERQRLQWLYTPQANPYLSSAEVGTLSSGGTGMIRLIRPRAGVRLHKNATTRDASASMYTISSSTTPGWVVEVYEGRQLLDWEKAGQDGAYRFDIPLKRGINEFTVRELGPSGEEHTYKEVYYLPGRIPKPGQWTYSLESSRIIQGSDDRFHKIDIGMGVTPHFMVRGGLESFSSLRGGLPVYYLEGLFQPSAGLSLEAGIAPGFRQSLRLSVQPFRQLSVQYQGERYTEDLEGAFIPNQEEHRVQARTSLKLGRHRIGVNAQGTWIRNGGPWRGQYQLGLSSNLKGTALRAQLLAMPSGLRDIGLGSNFSLSRQLWKAISFSGVVQASLHPLRLNGLQANLSKQFSKGARLGINYSYGVDQGRHSFGINYSLVVGPVQLSGNASRSDTRLSLDQSASGHLFWVGSGGGLQLNAQPVPGETGILLRPFVDANHNGRRDELEYAVLGLGVEAKGGRVEEQPRDSVILVKGLQASREVRLEFTPGFFEDIFWEPAYQSAAVVPDPNQYKRIDIPVLPYHEIYGYLQPDGADAQARIMAAVVYLYDRDGKLLTQAYPERDGYFSFTQIRPGRYWLTMNPQYTLGKEDGWLIEIKPSRYGQSVKVAFDVQ